MIRNIKPHVFNETNKLRTVIVGLPQSMGGTPTLEETYDARSYRAVEEGNYPLEEDIVEEMEKLVSTLENEGVEVLRPSLIENYNQLFARDVAFTIDTKLFIANMIADRQKEIDAYKHILARIAPESIVHLPEGTQAEGGDIMLYNDTLFIGVTNNNEFNSFKMARTNEAALSFFRKEFPNKRIVPIHLKKHDTRPEEGVLHLDCAFQPVGKGKAIYYPEAFANEEDRTIIEEVFGKENLFAITPNEAFDLTTNIFSVSPQKVIVEEKFTRLASHLNNNWNIDVLTIPYYEVSKQGGLLRCSTCPLVRE